MFGLRRERRLTELKLTWLQGYDNSRPVRTGNAAYAQFQLDVYGEVRDTLHLAQGSGLATQERAWGLHAGAEHTVVLRGNAVNYAVAGQGVSGLTIGGWKQTEPPRMDRDVLDALGTLRR